LKFISNKTKKNDFLLHSNHLQSYILKDQPVMLFGEITAVDCEKCTKCTNKLCGKNVEFLNIKAGGTNTSIYQCVLKR